MIPGFPGGLYNYIYLQMPNNQDHRIRTGAVMEASELALRHAHGF